MLNLVSIPLAPTSSLQTLLRVWDCLFYEGDKVLFRVGITLLRHNRDKILKCQHFPQIMSTVKAMVTDKYSLNCHEFMQVRTLSQSPGLCFSPSLFTPCPSLIANSSGFQLSLSEQDCRISINIT